MEYSWKDLRWYIEEGMWQHDKVKNYCKNMSEEQFLGLLHWCLTKDYRRAVYDLVEMRLGTITYVPEDILHET